MEEQLIAERKIAVMQLRQGKTVVLLQIIDLIFWVLSLIFLDGLLPVRKIRA